MIKTSERNYLLRSDELPLYLCYYLHAPYHHHCRHYLVPSLPCVVITLCRHSLQLKSVLTRLPSDVHMDGTVKYEKDEIIARPIVHIYCTDADVRLCHKINILSPNYNKFPNNTIIDELRVIYCMIPKTRGRYASPRATYYSARE